MKLPTRGCDCTACQSVRRGLMSATTLLPPGRKPVVDTDERDPKVVKIVRASADEPEFKF